MISPELFQFTLRILPAAIAFVGFFFLIPQSLKLLRIFAFILLFILVRDAMTPSGLWKITDTLIIRFIEQPLTLISLALSSLGLVVLSHFWIGPLTKRELWVRGSIQASILIGLCSGFLVALLPFLFGLVISRPAHDRPSEPTLIFAIFALTFFGNLLEETIFRGHFQTYLREQGLPQARVVALSGATFAICHVYLGFTVTSVGWPLLIFTFYEGILCAFLREKKGLLSAALAHGMGLFLLGIW